MRAEKSRLENGLRVVTVPLPHLHSAEIAIYIKTGGRNDPEGYSGLSHFLEHMLFRGTEDFGSPLEIESAFEELGGSVNAATDADNTCFYARIHPDYAEDGLGILASMMLRPKIDGIELERRIIREEALEDINEAGVVTNPDILMGGLLWPNHPLGWATVGSLADIERIGERQLRGHLDSFYSPANAVLVAAGPLDHRRMVEAAKCNFGGWKQRPIPAAKPVSAPGLSSGPVFVQDADSQATVQLAFHSFCRNDLRITTLKVLRRLLAGGGCSRLHMGLRERLGMVYSVESSIGAYDETGCITVDFSTAPENLATVLAETLRELRRLVDEPVPEKELERVRTAYLADLDYSRDSVTEMGARYGWGELMGLVRSIDEDQKLVRQVSPNGVQGLAGLLFKPENRNLVIVGPLEGIEEEKIRGILLS